MHAVLMEVAAEQANALAASEGAIGHDRPCGMTLGQELLIKGFPLWGDLSQDGYRSENWVAASTAEDTISAWLSDDEHTNTMLSEFRSDIGAAVAVSDQIYVVLETALRTRSGQMQSPAFAILTSIPVTQAACMGQVTPNAAGSISQYSVPVVVNTARPNGDVVHEVRYGQTLWSLAIEYKVSIEQIKRWNNLSDDTIIPGWKLLIQKNATQPPPATTTPIVVESIREEFSTPMPLSASTLPVTEIVPSPNAGQFIRQNSVVVVAFVISFSVLVAAIMGFGRKKV
jgi:LysM repeat protein